jgi:hypothetical protein
MAERRPTVINEEQWEAELVELKKLVTMLEDFLEELKDAIWFGELGDFPQPTPDDGVLLRIGEYEIRKVKPKNEEGER